MSPRGDLLAARIRAAAAYADLTRLELRVALNVSVETISAYYSGQSRPDVGMLTKLADATGVPFDFLLHGFDAPRPDWEQRLADVEARVTRLEIA